MAIYRPKIRENGTVQVGGYVWALQGQLEHYIGEKVEVEFNPVYPEAGAEVTMPTGFRCPMQCQQMYAGDLMIPKEINATIDASAVGGSGKYVYADLARVQKCRISKARTIKGVLEVRALSSGTWHVAKRVYQE